jgi:hypothetical protein
MTITSPVLLASAAFAALCFLPGTMSAPDATPSSGTNNPLSLREYLNLSDSQVKALDELQARRNGRARDSFQNLKRKQQSLRSKLVASNTGALSVGAAMLELELAKTRAELTTSELTEEAVSYLTPAQRAKLADLERLRRLQPAIREAGARFLLAPPDAVVNGTGPMGMFMPRKKEPGRQNLRRVASLSFPDAAQHSEHDQVMKAAME